MAKFTDLPNELVLKIGTYLRKPADILHLCIAERRSHQLMVPLMYEKISVDRRDYSADEKRLYEGLGTLRRLFKQQARHCAGRKKYCANYGRDCRSLTISTKRELEYPIDDIYNLFNLFPYLPALRKITLISTETYGLEGLESQWRSLAGTLETLNLSIGRFGGQFSVRDIHSLQHFKALKRLSIQSHILVCWNDLPIRHPYLGTTTKPPPKPLLSKVLPPNLKYLTIHCCELISMVERGDIADHVEAPCEGEVFDIRVFESSKLWAGKDRRIIDKVVVCIAQDGERGEHLHPSEGIARRLARLGECFDIVRRKVW